MVSQLRRDCRSVNCVRVERTGTSSSRHPCRTVVIILIFTHEDRCLEREALGHQVGGARFEPGGHLLHCTQHGVICLQGHHSAYRLSAFLCHVFLCRSCIPCFFVFPDSIFAFKLLMMENLMHGALITPYFSRRIP